MRHRGKRAHRLDALRTVLTSPFYILVTVVAALAYYALFYYLILASNYNVFFVTVPLYLIYLLIGSAAVLLAISVYAVSRSVRAKYAGAEGGMLSIVNSSLTGIVVGCSCSAPILSSVLYAIGFGTLQVGAAISFLGNYQSWFVLAFIAVNLVFIYYQLGRIIRIGK